MNIRLATKAAHRNNTFYVTSDTDANAEYTVHNRRNLVSHRKTWTCNCRDFTERQIIQNGTCKHIDEVQRRQRLGIAPFAFTPLAITPLVSADETRATPPAPAPKTAREALDGVMAVLNGGTDEQSRLLWDVISALRGPDDAHMSLKNETTARLRALVGMEYQSRATTDNAAPLGYDKQKAAEELTNRWTRSGSYEIARDIVTNRFGDDKVDRHFSTHYAKGLVAAIKLGYTPRG